MNNYNKKLSRTLTFRYCVSLLISLGIIMGLGLLCLAFFGTFDFWRNSQVLQRFIYWCRDYVFAIFLVCVFLSWMGCSIYFIRKPLHYLDELVDAAEDLTRPSNEPIILAGALSEAQTHLNMARERALWDARAARESEQKKNDLIVYLAHDLKTPLTSVIGYLTLLQDEPELSPGTRARYTGIALEKAERLEDLINEFFDITRFNLTHLELEKRPCDLSRMLQQVVSEFTPMLKERHLTCQLELPETLAYPCDPDKLARVFDNLLRNACYYSTEGSTIHVTAVKEPDFVRLTFINTGATIPEDKLKRIFEQFFRLDSSRASQTGGAGLGLAIAKEIVELHHGTISAQSVDGVTTFTVQLPEM